jgi:hypothetical protein
LDDDTKRGTARRPALGGTPALAAEEAKSYRRQLDLAAHFRKMKAERAKRATTG